MRITGLFNIRQDEVKLVTLSAIYFFLLLCAYYVLRPLREEMGVAGGVDNLPWLFLGTMTAMLAATPLFGLIASRFERRKFLPVAYRFFALNLLVFFAVFKLLPEYDIIAGRAFYIWISVFNLFILSLFWGLMADGFNLGQSKRLFALIAIGGTVGALVGSALTQQLAGVLGRINLLLVSVVLLEIAVQVFYRLDSGFRADSTDSPATVATTRGTALTTDPSDWLSGIRDTLRSPYLLAIAGYLFCYSLTSTFLYFEQATIISNEVSGRVQRTEIFATIDVWVNALTLLAQLFLSGRIISRFGVKWVLVAMPLLTLAGFWVLSLYPVLAVLMVFQIIRRASNYALFRPARETLFTVLAAEQKYKAKSFLDTFVYRGGDALGAMIFKVLQSFALGVASIAALVAPVALLWAALSWYLGNRQARLDAAAKQPKETLTHDPAT